MHDGEARDGVEKRGHDLRQRVVEEARALGTSEDEQMGCDGGRLKGEEGGAHGNAGDLGVAEPPGRGEEVDGGGLHALADEAVGESGHGVGFEGHGGYFEQDRGGHGGAGSVSANAEDDVGLEVSNQAAAGEDAQRQVEQGAQPSDKGDVFERADLNELKLESGFGNEVGFHAAGGADEEDFGGVARDQLAGHGECRDDVAAGSAAGDEYAQSQNGTFQ